jgi:CheY-like chemotaxis protein/tetratricopeptide (TPR) repeat protein
MSARILLAEDNQNLAQLLATFLQSAGHEVAIAATGRDTLRRLAAGSFDLLVLDLNLPEISGVEILQKLRKSPRMNSLPVIIITGVYKGEKYAQAALKLGVRHYLEKPFTKTAFSAAVDDTVAAVTAARRQPALMATLLTIYNDRQSGLLTIGDCSPIAFVKGEPASFQAAGKSDFPAFLLARGKISREDMQQFLAGGEGRLFFTEAGMLSFDDLQSESLHFLMKTLMEHLQKTAGISFDETATAFDPPLLHISMPRLFYEAVKLYPEEFRAEEFMAQKAVLFPARTPLFYRLANLLNMREKDILLLEKINGHRPVAELLQGNDSPHDAALFLNFLHFMTMITLQSTPGAEAAPGFFQKTLFNRPLDEESVLEEMVIDFDDIVEEVAENVVMAMGESGMAAPLSEQEISFEQTVQREFAQIKDKDYYAVFGMTPARFSFNTLKDAYFAKVREYSPERFMELSGATSAMAQDILAVYAEAYNTLSNVVAKERYDELLNDNKTIGIDGRQDGQLHAKIQFQSGQVFLDMGEFENAEKALQDAYTLEPDNAGHAAFLAWAIYRNSANRNSRTSLERARNLLAKSLQIEKNAEAFAFRGWMLLDEGRDGLAEGEFLKALKLNGKESHALKGLKLIADKKEAEKKGVLRRFFG